MRILGLLILSSLLAAGVCCRSTSQVETADLVLVNGSVWTVDTERPRAEAVAVRGDTILEVGTRADIEALIGPGTRVFDMRGGLLLPGFIDAHTHFLDGGFALSDIQLRESSSRKEFVDRIAAFAASLPKGEWILHGDWDHQSFDVPELPRKEWVDDVTPDNPVCVSRLDGHMIFANSLALKLAGVTGSTPVPPGGEIVLDPESGEPTGILKDEAMDLVFAHVPRPGLPEKIRAAEAAVRHALAHGVTSVHEMATAGSFEVYQDLQRLNRLNLRIYVYIPVSEVDVYARLRMKTPFGNDRLKIGGLKGFVDGSLGSFTALFMEPYSDDPSKRGILVADMYPEGVMEERLRRAEQAGLQVAVHAIGDKANRIILDLYRKIAEEFGDRDRRWRVEHAQHLSPDDIRRFGEMGVIASVQPYHAIDDGRWAESKIGPERLAGTYAFRSLLDTGARLACGSDWTVAPLDPLSGIYAAVTRRTLDGKNPQGWIPGEKITLEEAIRGYTLDAAFAEFAEDRKGSIRPGKLADLVLLDSDLFAIPPETIREARVVMTLLGGRVVFQEGEGS